MIQRTFPCATYFAHPRLSLTVVASDSIRALVPRSPEEVFVVCDFASTVRSPDQLAAMRTAQERFPHQVHFLSGTEQDHQLRSADGIRTHFINVGCFADEELFIPAVAPSSKLFDAAVVARLDDMLEEEVRELHRLTERIPRLAVIDLAPGARKASANTARFDTRPNGRFVNTRRLPPHLIVPILRQSACGLIISGRGDVPQVVAEYLLAGTPVLTTSPGSHVSAWQDAENAKLVEPSAEAVARAADEYLRSPRDAWAIRCGFLKRAAAFRERFRDELMMPLFKARQVNVDVTAFMKSHPFPLRPGRPVSPPTAPATTGQVFKPFVVNSWDLELPDRSEGP